MKYRSLLIVAAIGFGGAYVVAPLLTLIGLVNALQSGNSDDLNKYVDFSSVRSSLKEQLSTAILADPQMKGNPFAIAFSSMIFNTIIDNMITPSGLAVLITYGKAQASDREKARVKAELQNVNFDTLMKVVSVRGPFEFRLIPPRDTDQDPPEFVFRNAGLFDWKVMDIRVPQSIVTNK